MCCLISCEVKEARSAEDPILVTTGTWHRCVSRPYWWLSVTGYWSSPTSTSCRSVKLVPTLTDVRV